MPSGAPTSSPGRPTAVPSLCNCAATPPTSPASPSPSISSPAKPSSSPAPASNACRSLTQTPGSPPTSAASASSHLSAGPLLLPVFRFPPPELRTAVFRLPTRTKPNRFARRLFSLVAHHLAQTSPWVYCTDTLGSVQHNPPVLAWPRRRPGM